jgi:hypothetical protein
MKELATKEFLSAEDILYIISAVGANQDVMIIKNDGIRQDKHYTVMIIPSRFAGNMFRCDSNCLQEAIQKVLKQYIAILPDYLLPTAQ